ncbi:MAG TPA: hypothetical protein VD713_07365 [Sphingomonadales bacterium]|nr:hypothetical protein [Sphingomonadales bacterium]
MKSKRIFMGTMALVLTGAVALMAGGDHWAKLKAEIGLSDAQISQLESKFAELRPLKEKAVAVKTELKALETAASPDQKAISAKKAELDGIKKEWTAKSDAIYRSVMSKEQFAKFQTWQAEQDKQYAAQKKQ